MSRFASAALSLLLLRLAACGDDGAPPQEGSTGAAGTTGDTVVPTSSTMPDPSETGLVDGSSGGGDDDSAGGGQCDIYEQDCPNGEKCVPWSDQPDLVPDDIRCCPVEGEPKEVGDTCTVTDYFGSCLDDCAVGSFCLDPFDSGQGTCQKLCGGSDSNPSCEIDEKCFIYFAGVPICFRKCDPLVQDCGEGLGCYPDEEAEGGTGFICLPTIAGDGTYGDFCWLLSGCAPGFMCVYPDFLPDCNANVGCCTALCDTQEPDTCDQFHPDNECVSWYYTGQDPPSAQLQDVGACAIPPN